MPPFIKSSPTKLPLMDKIKRSNLLNYESQKPGMPITNPVDIAEKLEREFEKFIGK